MRDSKDAGKKSDQRENSKSEESSALVSENKDTISNGHKDGPESSKNPFIPKLNLVQI